MMDDGFHYKNNSSTLYSHEMTMKQSHHFDINIFLDGRWSNDTLAFDSMDCH